MDKALGDFLDGKLTYPETAGENKVMDLSEAVRRFIRPGMCIHTGNSMALPSATCYEIVRQFWGKEPKFTLMGITGGSYNYAIFAHGGLCSKIISAFNGDGYPFPGPNPALTRAFSEGRVVPESWSHLSLTLMLVAGAMGLPFLPTKSLTGSSMETENRDRFLKAPDPFTAGESIGLVKALNPDISLAHGWAADEDGNTILALPYSANHYGALAAKEGAIVTVEKIVDADFIRRYSYLTRIPGYVVRAVCLAPLGAHPVGQQALGIPDFNGYGEDEEFILEAREASRDPEQYQAWIDKWVLGCRDHGGFLALLGQKRIWSIMGRIHKDSWISQLSDSSKELPFPEKATQPEKLVIGASRKLMQIIKKKKYGHVLCGIGVSNLASWIAYYELRRAGVPLELLAEIGFYGYTPQPGDPFLFNLRNLPTCRMVSDIFTTLGVFMSGYNTTCIGVIGAGQIDRFGNVNTTRISERGPYLVGSGGANDVASAARETMVTVMQSKSRFIEKVPYITSPGTNVTTVVSQYGIFEKPVGAYELELTGYFQNATDSSEEDTITTIQEQCGWKLKIRDRLEAYPHPSPDEIKFLRCFDPKRLYLGKTD